MIWSNLLGQAAQFGNRDAKCDFGIDAEMRHAGNRLRPAEALQAG